MMSKILLAAALAGAILAAQTLAPPSAEAAQKEENELRQALGDAGNSPVDFERALENHLRKYPDSSRKLELERALFKTASDLKDDPATIKYGELVLAQQPDDPQILEKVCTALLRKGDKPSAQLALKYSEHFAEILKAAVDDKAPNQRDEAKLRDGADRANARAFLLEARAEGLLEHPDKGAELAEKSFSAYPNVEAAREASRWFVASGKTDQAVLYLAKALSIEGLKSTDTDAADDRVKIGELYKQWKGNDTGLGDLILQAYDQTSSLFARRRAALQKLDPNVYAKDPMQFTLSGVQGDRLPLSELQGKVIVMDFWATWCGPCRIQHPLYEEVKAKFKDRNDVVFLAIATDEDHSIVKPFLEQMKWNPKVYFEDGLGSLLQVTSIPTTVIINKKGEVASRMNGFVPDRFVELLAARIRESLNEIGKPTVAARN